VASSEMSFAEQQVLGGALSRYTSFDGRTVPSRDDGKIDNASGVLDRDEQPVSTLSGDEFQQKVGALGLGGRPAWFDDFEDSDDLEPGVDRSPVQ
jgi:hypothetical protein